MIDVEEMTRDVAALFSSSTLGPRVLQQILEYAGNNEAQSAHALSTEQLWMNHGARSLALDLATMAGRLPEVPGSGGSPEPNRASSALEGAEPPEGDEGTGQEAET